MAGLAVSSVFGAIFHPLQLEHLMEATNAINRGILKSRSACPRVLDRTVLYAANSQLGGSWSSSHHAGTSAH
jgi:hypothetical protein